MRDGKTVRLPNRVVDALRKKYPNIELSYVLLRFAYSDLGWGEPPTPGERQAAGGRNSKRGKAKERKVK